MAKKLPAGPVYADANGERHDHGLHDAMLENNPDADKAFAAGAVKIAISQGVPPETAQRIYGYRAADSQP